MSTLDDFTDSDSDEQRDRFDRSRRPDVKRKYPVRDPDDGTTLFGMLGVDRERETIVYTSPRNRDQNYFRKIGGYPISTDVLELLRQPPKNAGVDPVQIIYIIQIESTDDYPPYTVFEYDIRDYLDAQTIEFAPFGEQRCPTLDDARAVWPAKGEIMFETGEL